MQQKILDTIKVGGTTLVATIVAHLDVKELLQIALLVVSFAYTIRKWWKEEAKDAETKNKKKA